MYQNEIVEEIEKYREEYAKSFGYDLKAIFKDLQKKQLAHKHKLVKPPINRKLNKSFERFNIDHQP